jgi:acylphosphatase
MIINKTVIIKGKVQGVFFRASTREQAEALEVKGEVWNMQDGGVALIAEGAEEKVNALIRWCYSGPPRAEVKEVIVKDGKVEGYKNFIVKRL